MFTMNMEDSERETLERLEMIFLIELAQRKSFKENSEAMNELFNLRREIEQISSKHKGKEKYFGEEGSMFDDEIITDCVFNFLQGVNEEPAFVLHDEKEIYKKLGAVLARAYRERVNAVMVGLPYLRGFRLADFSYKNSILRLCAWWFYVCEEKKRKEHNFVEKHGCTSYGKEGFFGEIVYLYRLPLREPHSFLFPCFETKYFDLLRMNLEKGLHFFIVKDHSAKKIRNMDLMFMACLQIKEGNLARGKPYECKFAEDFLITDTCRRVLVKKVSSIDYLINGLICWDAINEPSLGKKRSIDDVVIRVAKTISKVCGTAYTDQNTLKGCYDRVSKLINSYTPAILPWLPEFDS